MSRGGRGVTAGLRAAWLIIFSLPVFSPANLPIQHNTAWFFLANQIFEDPQKNTFPWLIRHVFTPRRAEEQVARRATFWRKMVNLGDKFPDFEVDTSKGKIKFYEAIEGKWVLHVHLHNIFKKITSLNELVRGQLKFTMQEGHEVSKTLRFLSSSMIYSIDVTIKFIKG